MPTTQREPNLYSGTCPTWILTEAQKQKTEDGPENLQNLAEVSGHKGSHQQQPVASCVTVRFEASLRYVNAPPRCVVMVVLSELPETKKAGGNVDNLDNTPQLGVSIWRYLGFRPEPSWIAATPCDGV